MRDGRLAIRLERLGRDGHLDLGAILAVDEPQVAGQAVHAGIPLLRSDELQRVHIEATARDRAQPLLGAVAEQEVAEHDHDAAPLPTKCDRAHGLVEARIAGRRAVDEPLPEVAGAAAAAQAGERMEAVAAEGERRDAVVVHEPDVAERHGHAPGVVELAGRPKVHAPGTIDREHQAEVLLLEEELQEQPVQPAVDVPVDEAKVIARDVGPEVGELHALPTAAAASLALDLALEDLAARHIERIEPCHERTIDELVDGLRRVGTVGHGTTSVGVRPMTCSTMRSTVVASASASKLGTTR